MWLTQFRLCSLLPLDPFCGVFSMDLKQTEYNFTSWSSIEISTVLGVFRHLYTVSPFSEAQNKLDKPLHHCASVRSGHNNCLQYAENDSLLTELVHFQGAAKMAEISLIDDEAALA